MKHLVIFRLSALGDVAMTKPVIKALLEQYPNVCLTMVSRPFCQPLFDGIDRLTFIGGDTKKQYNGLQGIYRLYKDLRALQPDYFLDFHDVLRSKIIRSLMKISGVSVEITDKGRQEKKALTRTKNKIFRPLQSMVERHADTLRRAGFPIELPTTKITKSHNHNQPKKIGIAPFAQHPTKVYSLELMKKVINGLKEYEVYLFGSKAEKPQLETLMKGQNHCKIVSDFCATFREELHFIQTLDLMLSMDSANGHLASNAQIPVLTIWGNTHPYVGFTPFLQPENHQLTPDVSRYPLLPTSVYGNKRVEGYERVIDSISPEQILQKITEILN